MQTKRKSRMLIWALAVAVMVVFVGPAFGQDEPVIEEPPLEDELLMPGTVKGTGTYFEVTDSNYLNITLSSSETVTLRLESTPQMVTIDLEAAEDVASTQITLSGFEASTTYYKYDDNYHNGVAFTTDGNGSYSFAQDLAIPHLVFIQPQAGTIFLSDSGWSDPTVGTWDPVTKTGTLTTDLSETLQIDSDGITLDGNGNSVAGSGTGYGIIVSQRNGVNIKNLTVEGFSIGIYLSGSSDNTLTGNSASDNSYGIYMYSSGGNTLRNNAMSDNQYNFTVRGTADSHFDNDIDTTNTVGGKPVYYLRNVVGPVTYDSSTNAGVFCAINCNNITIKDLTLTNNWAGLYLWNTQNSCIENVLASNNAYGIRLSYCSDNTLTGNAISNNMNGICVGNSNNNTLTGNTAWTNGDGIELSYSINNTLTGNSASDNSYGIYLDNFSYNNTLTGNSASDNSYGICLFNSGYNTLTGNTANSNGWYGIHLYHDAGNNNLTGNTVSNNLHGIGVDYCWSSGNTLTGNTASNNVYGIHLLYSDDNEIYNNNFIGNSTQAYIARCRGNVFNLDKPIGGNYWSDWTSPDDDGDGFVDHPYVFYGRQDDLPWTRENGWVPTWIKQLIYQVEDLNLQQGIDNSLDAKLDAAMTALDDVNENNDVAAINTLNAFINAVEAQRGKKITEEDAHALIAAAQEIIDLLTTQ